MTQAQLAALDMLNERLAGWEENGETEFTATDFAIAARKVLGAFAYGFKVELDLDASLYQAKSGTGRVLFASPNEKDAKEWLESLTS